jgi:hypothetical protein
MLPEKININEISIIDGIIYYQGCEPYVLLEQVGSLKICTNERQVALKQNTTIHNLREALSQKLSSEVGLYTSRHTHFVYPFVQLVNREILTRNYSDKLQKDVYLPLTFFEKNVHCLHCKYVLKVGKLCKKEQAYNIGFTLVEIHYKIKETTNTTIKFDKLF